MSLLARENTGGRGRSSAFLFFSSVLAPLAPRAPFIKKSGAIEPERRLGALALAAVASLIPRKQ